MNISTLLLFACLWQRQGVGGGQISIRVSLKDRRSLFFLCVRNFSISYPANAANLRQSPGKRQQTAANGSRKLDERWPKQAENRVKNRKAVEVKRHVSKHLPPVPVWFNQEALDPADGWVERAPTKSERIRRTSSVLFSDGSSCVWRLLAAKKLNLKKKRVSKK
jgi:hypothetical protein